MCIRRFCKCLCETKTRGKYCILFCCSFYRFLFTSCPAVPCTYFPQTTIFLLCWKRNESIVLQHNHSIYGTFIAYYEHIKRPRQESFCLNSLYMSFYSLPLHVLVSKTTWVLLLEYHTDPNHPPAMWESSKNITRYIFSLYYMHILHNRESIRLYPNVPLFHISTPTRMPFPIMGAMSRARGLFCFLNKFLIFTENILEQEAMESSAFPDNLYCKLIFVKWHTMEIS